MTSEQKRIERAYQRAMNIRDSTPGVVPAAEEYHYMKAYRKAYKTSNWTGFTSETRLYLRHVRKAAGEE